MNQLALRLIEEQQSQLKGGLYHKTQVNLAYNSNRIEGSKLTEEQTRYIFETHTIGFANDEAVLVDDILETANHFAAFDYLLETLSASLSNEIIREFHRILKNGTSDARKSWFNVGNWKKQPNEVGGVKTSLPKNVEAEMQQLNAWHNALAKPTFEQIVEYHFRFEKIHPFQDGNGRVGRLVMFRECLRHEVIPFIIDELRKQFYYRGLKEFNSIPSYLFETCLSAQDKYAEWIRYFYPDLSE
jgi:Fic family protein